jgi:hypothetical protein
MPGWLSQLLLLSPRLPAFLLPLAACRYFLDNVAGWILELDRGSGIPFEGNYSGVGGGGWSCRTKPECSQQTATCA